MGGSDNLMIKSHERVAEGALARAVPVISETTISRLILTVAIISGAFLRVWEINVMGYNTDEAVYAGQAAAIAGVPGIKDLFPIFRAHPLLFQFLVSLTYHNGFNDLYARLLAAMVGIGAIFLTYQVGKTLYGRMPGALAALIIALMPYHVIVSRQMLLDGPMMFNATLTLYMLARFGRSQRTEWLYAAGVCMGLTFLSKETGIILMGAIYTFLALAHDLHLKIKHLIGASIVMGIVIAPFPLTLMLGGGSSSGQNYLIWQLFRRPNHDWLFYPTVVPPAIGILVLIIAALGLAMLYRERSWREKLLLAWIGVPFAFFQVWPVKGFQYLLPIAPAVAVLAGRLLGRLASERLPRHLRLPGIRVVNGLMAGVMIVTLAGSSWQTIQPATSDLFLAGTGGIPGGRELGAWILENVPVSATFVTIGPSMANIVQFYGHRKAYGLSVSPNPLRRNPSYEPVNNPDFRIRNNQIHYVVWDSYSAARSTFFSDGVMNYVAKYHGRAVHTESVKVQTLEGAIVEKAVIVIYEVRP